MKVYFGLFLVLLFWVPLVIPAQNQSHQNEDEPLAAQFLREGDFARAVVIYEELFEEDQDPVIYNNYLICLLELNEFRKAERVVSQQIRNNPGSYRFEVDLGYVFTRSGDSRSARRQLEGLLQNVTGVPVSVVDLANAFIFRGFYDYALQTYQKGRSIFKNTFPFNLQIASIHEKRGNISEMMREYVDLVAVDISYLENVQAILQDALNNDPDFTKAEALRMVLLQRAQESSAQVIYAELLLWLSIQQKDFSMALRQARAIDRRLQQDGELVLDVARLSASNSDFQISKQGFENIIERGDLNPYYMEAHAGLLNVKYKEATSGHSINIVLLREVEAEYHSMIDRMGIRPHTVGLIRNLANLKAFYLGKPDEATDLLNMIIAMPNVSNRIKAECRIELADILVLQGQLWDAHLIYALVDRTFRDDPLAHEARFKNARLSFYMGEFKWAKAQLDVLKAATSRLIANDAMSLSILIQDNLDENDQSEPLEIFARAQKHTFMNNFDMALKYLYLLHQKYPAHQIIDDVLMERAMIYKRTGRYEDADKALAKITDIYPAGILAAQALFERAQLYEEIFRNTDEALKLYQQLVVNYPGTIYTATARNKFRQLRGDLVN